MSEFRERGPKYPNSVGIAENLENSEKFQILVKIPELIEKFNRKIEKFNSVLKAEPQGSDGKARGQKNRRRVPILSEMMVQWTYSKMS